MADLKIIFQTHRGIGRPIKSMTDKELEAFRIRISNTNNTKKSRR